MLPNGEGRAASEVIARSPARAKLVAFDFRCGAPGR